MMNPMQMMMRQMMGGGMPAGNMQGRGMNPLGAMGGFNRPQIDKNKMKQYAGSIDDVQLNNLAAQARAQGIPDADIQAGLNFIKQLRR